MPHTHELKVSYVQGRELASWDFDSHGTQKCCDVQPGDKIHVSFDGPGDIGECVLLCGQMQDGLPSSAFTEGSRIDLKKSSTLTVAQQMGRWGFSIAFTARNADATTSFYYVPDPEVDVGSKA